MDSYDLLATANTMESEGMAAAVADNLQDAGFDDAAADPADTTTFNEEVVDLPDDAPPPLSLTPLSPSPLSLPHATPVCRWWTCRTTTCAAWTCSLPRSVVSLSLCLVNAFHPVQALFGPCPNRAIQYSSPYPPSRLCPVSSF